MTREPDSIQTLNICCIIVSSSEDFTLEDLVQFITGAPYFATNCPLTIKFALPTHENVLPVAHACFSELVLPTVHQTYSGFRQAMVIALEYGGVGFGLA